MKNLNLNKTVSQIIVEKLKTQKVKYVCGYSGGCNLALLDSFYDTNNSCENDTIKFIQTAHEQAAGHISEAISKSTNNIGVTIGTSGPGTTNLMTSVYNAFTDNIAMLYLTGQVNQKSIGMDAFQECDSTNIFKKCTKLSYQLRDPNEIDTLMNYSIKLAMGKIDGRRGPVHIDIPKDVQTMIPNITTDYKTNQFSFFNNIENMKLPSNNEEIKQLKYHLNSSKRPVLYVGQGCINSYNNLKEISELLNIPVTTTLHGLGCFDETHPNSLKMVGMHGSVYANYAIQYSDLILCIGARFDDRTTGNLSKYARNSIKIHVDIDPNRLKKIKNIINLQLSIHDDANLFLQKLKNSLSKDEIHTQYHSRNAWFHLINVWKNNYQFKTDNTNYSLTIPDVLQAINSYIHTNNLCEKTTFTTGVGNHQMFTAQYIDWKFPNKIITSGSFGVMGTCVPFGIGAKLSRPDDIVICIDGDSSFNMSSHELFTILNNKNKINMKNIKIFIMNDGEQKMVKTWQKLFFDQRYIATENINPNYQLIAKAYGIKTVTCSNKNNLLKTIKYIFDTDDIMICIFNVQGQMCTPFVPPNNGLHEMIFNEPENTNTFDKNNAPS